MKKAAVYSILFFVLTSLAACGAQPLPPETRDENLAKLGKVWGFAKYTHHAFISGQLDWDDELLNLIPVISRSKPEDVNQILYAWFVGLGEDGYGLGARHDFDITAALPTARPALRPSADLSWINEDYLGPLAARLQRFDGITAVDRSAAPVFFDPVGTPNFSNQRLHSAMDHADAGYRLLGLFRLWNAMKYYWPNLSILDVVWNDLLIEFIPQMLAGTDGFTYEQTLYALSHHVRDATHLSFTGTTFISERFGRYAAPVSLIGAEGRLVVTEAFGYGNPLERGDAILGVNGGDIADITSEMLRYLPYPNTEKALAYLARGGLYHPIRSHTGDMEIEVLRNGERMAFNVSGIPNWRAGVSNPVNPYVILDGNIGLINPAPPGNVHTTMERLAGTDGIIIDLRQYPGWGWEFFLGMRQYLSEEPLPFAIISTPSRSHPGARVDTPINQYLPRDPRAFVYDRPVMLLMDEQTISQPEWVIMAFRTAPQVTVMGPWSKGSNGNITHLPLPGGIRMRFTGLGVYTPEGGQTHRIGLAPDIRVDYTVQGIREGRDELMEAAVRFIRETR